jgi:DNA (cytosine-5)-methyltransferase 1
MTSEGPFHLDDEFHSCSLIGMTASEPMSVAGLFAGIGGIELGLHDAGLRSKLLCEWWEPAQAVLSDRFPAAEVVGDIRDVDKLPDVDLVTAGFPCTDLSQAGRTKGIAGEASGLVAEVFRLLRDRRVPLLMLENVRNMLVLDKGEAMRFLVDELESLGYRWAYRLVDSRFTGVPQRRQRVIFIASLDLDPSRVLFADDAGEPPEDRYDDDLHGFSWTEGLRGLGWARDAVPTLKGGSTIGIPSPPAIWNPAGVHGSRIVTPRIFEAERLQGFPAGWTKPADIVCARKGTRWRLVGNAVTVGVSRWVGDRLTNPGEPIAESTPLATGAKWPKAAAGELGKRWAMDSSMWPRHETYQHLGNLVDVKNAPPLSARATAGFLERTGRSSLRFDERFLTDIEDHAALMADESRAA